MSDPLSRSAWRRAAELADRTPESRNRYVDFLRALSILAVVLGHWIMAAPYHVDDTARLDHILAVTPWSRWLTWLFQVMPVFFFVGGFSNGTSWDAAQRGGTSYAAWLDARLRRLLGPVMPLLFVWAAMAATAHALGVPADMIRVGSQVALVPVWFLAVYLLVTLLVPLSRAVWRRWGMSSCWTLFLCACLVDVAFFVGNLGWFGWLNYLFIWLAVHQLGYAWQAGRLGGPRRSLPYLLVGLPALILLTQVGPYPLSLVGVPGEKLSNSLPPKLPLLALGAAQIGLLLTLEVPMRRWLRRKVPWTATVLINGMIMTVFLWHSTVMMLLIGLGFRVAPQLHSIEPGTATWWAQRPLWVGAYALALLPFVLVFSRFERAEARRGGRSIALGRLLLGSLLICAGLAQLALHGVGGNDWLGLRIVPLTMPFVGAAVAGFGPLARLIPSR